MKKKNKIKNAAKKLYNLFVLDRSGSMMGLRQSTIESVNGQIESLRSDAKKNENVSILCSLLLFDSRGDDSFHFCYVNTPVGDVKNITEADYLPNGGTPLRDAIGVGIQRLQRELGDSIGHDDVNILVTIFTDGAENSSTQFSHDQISKMIKHLSSDKKWTFSFIGSGGIAEVQAYSTSLNICASNTMAYDGTKAGYTRSVKKLQMARTSYVSNLAAGKDVSADFFAGGSEEESEKKV